MKFYFLKGLVKSFKSGPKSEIGLISAKEVLTDLNVTFEDPCCPTDYAPVRYNKDTSELEYLFNAETGEYRNVNGGV